MRPERVGPKLLHLGPTKYLAALLILGILVTTASPVLASDEQAYVNNLQSLLTKAADHLTRARVALQLCLGDQITCISNPELFHDDIILGKSGIENVRGQLQELDVPEKYAEIHILALEGLVDISVALGLLVQGLDQGEPGPIELAAEYIESGRNKILTVYERIAETPPEEPSGISDFLWPLMVAMVAVVAINSVLAVRSVRGTLRRRRAEASRCPYCGQKMRDWRDYPTKVIQGWMSDHIEAYHSEES